MISLSSNIISYSLILFLAFMPLLISSLPHSQPKHIPATKPAYFLLAGDSTTATQSTNGGGWGDGFLNHTLKPGSSGRNLGHNGATTKSFREGGDWDRLLAEAKEKTSGYTVYVTIQFGHNDQKNTSGVSTEQYVSNLETFADEISNIGCIPILVTPLSRRKFLDTKPPRIDQSLSLQQKLTLLAANESRSRHIDLNEASTEFCEEIGPEKSWRFNLNEADYTHLNVEGSVVFGKMVAGLMREAYPDIAAVRLP